MSGAVMFKTPGTRNTGAQAVGRNGSMIQSGVDVHHDEWNDLVQLRPIASRGVTSFACRIEIPCEDLPALIAELQRCAGSDG